MPVSQMLKATPEHESSFFGRRSTWPWLLSLLILLTAVQCRELPSADGRATPAVDLMEATAVIGISFSTAPAPTQAILPETVSVMASSTPIPTATPIVYQVKEGDTLWSIAFHYEATVEQLLNLNPGIRPEVLQIGQAIVVPVRLPPEDQLASASSTVALAVASVSTQRNPGGGFWILGEVRNDAEQPVQNAIVSIVLGNGPNPPRVETEVRSRVIWPGERAPFGLLVASLPADSGDIVTQSAGEMMLDHGNLHSDLAVTLSEVTITGDMVALAGQARNEGGQTAEVVALVVTLYDSSGNVTGFGQLVLEQSVPAGGVGEFEMTFAPPRGGTVDYRVTATALAASNPPAP